MELFAINRYGDTVEKDPENEDKILQNLLKKAEKRKRKLEKTKHSNENLETKEAPAVIDEKSQKDDTCEDEIESKRQKTSDIVKNEEITQSTEETNGNFLVLGSDISQKKEKVHMVLPPWLANPVVIDKRIGEEENDEAGIQNLTFLSSQIKNNLKTLGIDRLFPVQKEVIPWILKAHSKPVVFRPRDICVSSPTGSGKTLAFAVPIVQLLSKRVELKIRALVVLPVTELALQVFKVFKKLVEKTNLCVYLLSKSNAFATEQQKLVECFKDNYYSKVDIVVTTPGRLVEHLHATKGFCLKNLKFLVIDEADRIMEQIHFNWLYHLDAHVKNTTDMFLSGRSAPLCLNSLESQALKQPHKLLFSATLSQDPEKLQDLKLFQPKLFTSVINNIQNLGANLSENPKENSNNDEVRGNFIGKYTTPAELTEKYCLTENRIRPLTLYSLIKENDWNKFLCFTNTTEGAHRLAFVLDFLFQKTIKIAELSSSLNPKKRTSVLSEFAKGKINGLVSSDALTRGIDIPDVDIVISYDCPRHVITYIHRIGRTARAGRLGTSVTLLAGHELQKFNQLLSEAGKELTEEIKVKTNIEENNANRYTEALNILQKNVEKQKKLKTIQKNIAREKATPVFKENMTLMEKFQLQAQEAIVNRAKVQKSALKSNNRRTRKSGKRKLKSAM